MQTEIVVPPGTCPGCFEKMDKEDKIFYMTRGLCRKCNRYWNAEEVDVDPHEIWSDNYRKQ